MFQGSEHLPKGDRPIGSSRPPAATRTAPPPRTPTQYWEQVPSNALEQMLYIESDRMGFLLPTLTQDKLDNQREVVRNERRQSYEMRPYGLAYEHAPREPLRTPSSPTTGCPSARTRTCRRRPSRTCGTSSSASTARRTRSSPSPATSTPTRSPRPRREVVRRHPRQAAAGPPEARAGAAHAGEAGHHGGPGPAPAALRRLADAEGLRRRATRPSTSLGQVLTDGKSARLVKRLVMDERIAQERLGRADEPDARLACSSSSATPEAGRHPRAAGEGDRRGARAPRRRARLRRVSSSAPRTRSRPAPSSASSRWAASAAAPPPSPATTCAPANPGYLGEDLARYRSATAEDVSAAAKKYLRKDARVVLYVVPRGRAVRVGAVPEAFVRHARRRAGGVPMSRRLSTAAVLAARARSRRLRRPAEAGRARRGRTPPPRRPPSAAADRASPPEKGPPPRAAGPGAEEVHARRTGSGSGSSSTERLPIVALNLVVDAGAARDPGEQPGLASFTAAMITEGTKTRSATQISDEVGFLGASLGAGASVDSASLSGGTLARHLAALPRPLRRRGDEPGVPEGATSSACRTSGS